jgi:hypothetical protein
MEEENSEDMLHIILFILKIIGIILASIIGLLLFIIVIVLLVPIKYRVTADKKEDLMAEAKITWLFRLLYLHISFKDNHYKMRFRILGKVFYDSDTTKDKGKGKKLKKKKLKKKKNSTDHKEGKNKVKSSGNKNKVLTIEKSLEKTKDDNQLLIIEYDKDAVSTDPKQNLDENNKNITIDITKDKRNTHTIKENERHIDDNLVNSKDYFNNYSNNGNDDECSKKTFLQKIIRILDKIKAIFSKIKSFFLNINTTKQKIIDFFLNINEKWAKIKDFFHDEINKLGLSKSLRSLYKVLKHLHPKKLKIEIEIGTGDPCTTGQVVGLLAVVYGYYGENVQIIPNFETSILEGSIFCLGRIRIATLLIICIKLILNDHFKQLIKNMKAFKEEL